MNGNRVKPLNQTRWNVLSGLRPVAVSAAIGLKTLQSLISGSHGAGYVPKFAFEDRSDGAFPEQTITKSRLPEQSWLQCNQDRLVVIGKTMTRGKRGKLLLNSNHVAGVMPLPFHRFQMGIGGAVELIHTLVGRRCRPHDIAV